MPVLAIGGEAAFGPMMAAVMRFATTDVQEAIIPASGHWIMEENPRQPLSSSPTSCSHPDDVCWRLMRMAVAVAWRPSPRPWTFVIRNDESACGT
jgi:hypothetical protein